ncbi:unnamed protein product, partial [Amoebophrya sp. A25]
GDSSKEDAGALLMLETGAHIHQRHERRQLRVGSTGAPDQKYCDKMPFPKGTLNDKLHAHVTSYHKTRGGHKNCPLHWPTRDKLYD